jgi:hypothetical protein
LGGRALLAFQGSYDRDHNGEPTPDALLGAIMQAEFQHSQMQLLELTNKWAEGWAKSKRGRRK